MSKTRQRKSRGIVLQPPCLQLTNIHTNLMFQETVRFQSKYTMPVKITLSALTWKRYQLSPSTFNLAPNQETLVTVSYCITSRDRLDPQGIFHQKAKDARGARDPCFRVQIVDQHKGQTIEKFMFHAFVTFKEDNRSSKWSSMFKNNRREG